MVLVDMFKVLKPKTALPTNISCAECRAAKVKCTRIEDGVVGHGTPRCVRCTRNDLKCVTEARRSKWDLMRSAPPAPAELARDLLPIIPAIDTSRPFNGAASHPCGYAAERVLRLSLMIEAALERDDAQALAVAISTSIAQFRLKPSLFAHVLAGGKAHNTTTHDVGTNYGATYGPSTSGGGRPNEDEMLPPSPATPNTTNNDGPSSLSGELPFALPPYMATHYASEAQVHTRTHARTHTRERTPTHARARTRTHAHTHAHACTHT